MSLYIPDASVILDFFLLQGERGKRAEVFFKDVQNFKHEVMLPAIWFYEVANTLGRTNDPSTKTMYKDRLCLFRDKIFKTVNLDQDTTQIAFSLMEQFKSVSFYDSSYHALAIQQKGIFLTSDKKYFDNAEKAGFIELF